MRRDLGKRTFEFAKRIVVLCKWLHREAGVSRLMANQLFRSGTSIGANVEEGAGSHSEADYLYKCGIACKEARETLYWLRLLAETNTVPAKRLKELLLEANEIVAILTSIVRKIKAKHENKA